MNFAKVFFLLVFCLSTLANKADAHKIAIEGMPGAGKSTSLLKLISDFQNCILLSETNPEPEDVWNQYSDVVQGDIFHRIWLERMNLADGLESKIDSLFFDRSYYSNLAYKYASDKFLKTKLFDDYVKIFNKDLKDKPFSLIIVLDVDPEIGLARRNLHGDKIAYPWSDVNFLKEFRKFYANELYKFSECPVVTICTDHLTRSEVKAKIKEEIEKIVGISSPIEDDDLSNTFKDQILQFAEENHLGKTHSNLITVFGCPTMYFRQHSVQIYQGNPIFLNNKRLKEIVNE